MKDLGLDTATLISIGGLFLGLGYAIFHPLVKRIEAQTNNPSVKETLEVVDKLAGFAVAKMSTMPIAGEDKRRGAIDYVAQQLAKEGMSTDTHNIDNAVVKNYQEAHAQNTLGTAKAPELADDALPSPDGALSDEGGEA